MTRTIPDGGCNGDPDRDTRWETIGRELLLGVLSDCRADVEDAFRDAEEALWKGDDLTDEQVRALRIALNEARWHVEEHLAPAAGSEPWEDPAPQIPSGVLWELTDHPKAEGVGPSEHVEDVEDSDE